MSNNPYRSTTPDWAYTSKDTCQPPQYEPPEDNRPRCRVCGVPMSRVWFFINVDGPAAERTEHKFEHDDFCSIRCLKRRLNGLPDDDEQAMHVLLSRVETAEAQAEDAKEIAAAHETHFQQIREALAVVLEVAPGLVRGAVPPPGGLLARRVSALQSIVGQRVLVDVRDRHGRPL